jgi:hypothetical protein
LRPGESTVTLTLEMRGRSVRARGATRRGQGLWPAGTVREQADGAVRAGAERLGPTSQAGGTLRSDVAIE